MAITEADSREGSGSTITMNNACSPNDLLVLFMVAGNIGGLTSLTVADTVNTGVYSLTHSVYEAVPNKQYQVSYIVCNASGTPTISIPGMSIGGGVLFATRFHGYVGTPTWGGEATCELYNNTSTTAVASAVFTGSQNSELVMAFGGDINNVAFFSPGPSGWTQASDFSSAAYLYYKTLATAGLTAQLVGTLNTAGQTGTMLAGFYDLNAPLALMGQISL